MSFWELNWFPWSETEVKVTTQEFEWSWDGLGLIWDRYFHFRAFLWSLAMIGFGFIILGFDTREVAGRKR